MVVSVVYDANNVRLNVPQFTDGFNQFFSPRHSMTNDKDDTVEEFTDNERVRNDVHGRQVDDDILVLIRELIEELLHAILAEELGRVGRNNAGGQEHQILMQAAGDNALLLFADQDAGQAEFGFDTDGPFDTGLSHVGAYKDGLVSFFGDGVRKIDGGITLSFVRDGTGNTYDLTLSFLIRNREEYIRT